MENTQYPTIKDIETDNKLPSTKCVHAEWIESS